MSSTPPALQALIDPIRAAVASGQPLRIRGGGSKDFYGHSLHGEVLDTTGWSGITSYEPSELVVTVRAGTPLAELEAALAEKGQCLPFEPPHFGWSGNKKATHVEPLGERVRNSGPAAGSVATVGGMVAAGLAGPARASVGGVRDYVLGVQMVNGRAEQLTFGGQVMKNVAGYDVSRLMVGAMGTLGLITEVSLKVLGSAPAEATLCFALPQAAALEQLHRWGGEPLPLNASCWVHDDSNATQPAQDLLFVRLRGAAAAVEAACKRMLAEQVGVRMDNAQAMGDWALCRDQQLPFFLQCPPGMVLWRISLPQTASVLDLPWPQLVEWHGALRWLWAPADSGPQLQALARMHGGNAMLFVADCAGNTLATAPFAIKNSPPDGLQARIKASFDPHGIFNPQRLPQPPALPA